MSDQEERRKKHTPDEELAGMAKRLLREGGTIDELPLRLKNRDGSAGPDVGREDELRKGVKGKLLAAAGHTQEMIDEKLDEVERKITTEQKIALLFDMERRLADDSIERYREIWPAVKKSLEAAGESVFYGLLQMKENGHEVRVGVQHRGGKKGFLFYSASKESPVGKRNVTYPEAEAFAKKWGVDLMDSCLFNFGLRDQSQLNKSTWDYLATPPEVLATGEAYYGDEGRNLSRDAEALKRNALDHDVDGGFRCEKWIPEV